jgi:hypothetical protein
MKKINKSIIIIIMGTADPIIDDIIHPSIALSMISFRLNLTKIISCGRHSSRNSFSFIRRICVFFSPLPPNIIDAQFLFLFLFKFFFLSLSLSLSPPF